MNAANKIWYVVYIIANIFTLGTFWFLRNLITYAVRLANEED